MRVQLLLFADARLLKIESDPTNPLRVPIVSISFRKSTKHEKKNHKHHMNNKHQATKRGTEVRS